MQEQLSEKDAYQLGNPDCYASNPLCANGFWGQDQ
jgi:hypothetical protein